MPSVKINGDVSKLKAEKFNDGVFIENIPLNAEYTDLSTGGYDPVTETSSPADEVRVRGKEGGYDPITETTSPNYYISEDLPVGNYNPVSETTANGWTNEGDYWLHTVTPSTDLEITPVVAVVPNYLNLTFIGDTGRYTVEIYDGVDLVETVATDVVINIPDTYLGYEIRVIPNTDVVIDSIHSSYPYDPIWEQKLYFTDDGNGVYVDTLIPYHFENSGSSYNVDVSATEETTTVSPMNQIFLADNDVLTALSDVPMTDPTSADTNRANYIINILDLPFPIPVEYVGQSSSIFLGDHDTSVDAPIVLNDSITIDLGSISVSGIGNSLDFASTYQLYLPFVQTVTTLNPSDVVGKTLNLEYVLDVYTGDVTVNVYNGVQTSPINSFSEVVGRKLPFRMQNTVNDSLGDINGIRNNVLTPFVRVRTPELVEGEFNNMVTVEGDLSNVSGYIEFTNVKLGFKADSVVKNEIRNQLLNGVVINE